MAAGLSTALLSLATRVESCNGENETRGDRTVVVVGFSSDHFTTTSCRYAHQQPLLLQSFFEQKDGRVHRSRQRVALVRTYVLTGWILGSCILPVRTYLPPPSVPMTSPSDPNIQHFSVASSFAYRTTGILLTTQVATRRKQRFEFRGASNSSV